MEPDWIVLAGVRRARGIRGEVVLTDLGTRPERFVPGFRVSLGERGGGKWFRFVEVEDSWTHGNELVVKFRGIDTRTEAEEIQGYEIRIPIEERPPAPEGEYYFSDLVGCEVITRDARRIGQVVEVQELGPHPILVVREKGEVLIPFVSAFCVDIDVTGRKITVELPEGLEEVNR